MTRNFSERFKSARLLRGYSLQGLADALENKVSRQALHRYEKGEVIPDDNMLNSIAIALRLPIDYFLRQTIINIEKVEFRKQEQLQVKEQGIIIEQTKEYLSRYLELEGVTGTTQDFINPLKDNIQTVHSYDEANIAAEKLRELWGLGETPISNVIELLEEKNIKIIKIDADLSFDGLQAIVNGNIPVIAYNAKLSNKQDRIRFTLLHELAHLMLSYAMLGIPENNKETLCHQFAGAMLLPTKSLKEKLGDNRTRISIQELGNIKRQYGISMQAVVMRAKECNIINDHYTKQFFFMMKQMNWRVDEPIDYEGTEESNRFEQILFRALAEEVITVEKAAFFVNQDISEFKKAHFVL